MRFLMASAVKDLKWRLADPAALALWVGIPLILGTLVGLATGGGDGGALKAKLLVVDQDETLAARLLIGAFGQGQLGEMFDVEEVDLEIGEARMADGEATAMLVIPPELAMAVLREEPATLQLVTNPAQRILPGIVEQVLEVLVEGVFYLQQLFGDQLRMATEELPDGLITQPDAAVADIATQINQALGSLEGTLFPPVITLETVVDRPEGQTINFALLFFPGMMFMSLIFVAQGMSEDLWAERKQGTLRRVAVAPGSMAAFLGGKLLAAALLMAAVSFIGVLLGVLLIDVELSRLPLAVAWSTLGGLPMLCIFMLVQLLAKTQRGGGLLVSLVMFPLLMIGGSFFPTETMPGWMVAIGSWTPIGMAIEQLKALMVFDYEWGELGRTAAALAMSTVVMLSAVWWRLRTFAVQ